MTVNIAEAEQELCVLIALKTKQRPGIFLKVAGNRSLTWHVKTLGGESITLNKSHRKVHLLMKRPLHQKKNGTGDIC